MDANLNRSMRKLYPPSPERVEFQLEGIARSNIRLREQSEMHTERMERLEVRLATTEKTALFNTLLDQNQQILNEVRSLRHHSDQQEKVIKEMQDYLTDQQDQMSLMADVQQQLQESVTAFSKELMKMKDFTSARDNVTSADNNGEHAVPNQPSGTQAQPIQFIIAPPNYPGSPLTGSTLTTSAADQPLIRADQISHFLQMVQAPMNATHANVNGIPNVTQPPFCGMVSTATPTSLYFQPNATPAAQQQSGPNVTSATQHPSGASVTSATQHPSGPNVTSAPQHPPGASVTSDTQQPSGPTATSATQQQPRPNVTSATQQPSGPTVTSVTQRSPIANPVLVFPPMTTSQQPLGNKQPIFTNENIPPGPVAVTSSGNVFATIAGNTPSPFTFGIASNLKPGNSGFPFQAITSTTLSTGFPGFSTSMPTMSSTGEKK